MMGMETRTIYGVSYLGAVALTDAMEAGVPYNFKSGNGEEFRAIVQALEPNGLGGLQISLEVQ